MHVEVFGDVAGIARPTAAALPPVIFYDQVGGPFYDTSGHAHWSGKGRPAVAKVVWQPSPQSELGDRSAADWIADGRPSTQLNLARAGAHGWGA